MTDSGHLFSVVRVCKRLGQRAEMKTDGYYHTIQADIRVQLTDSSLSTWLLKSVHSLTESTLYGALQLLGLAVLAGFSSCSDHIRGVP